MHIVSLAGTSEGMYVWLSLVSVAAREHQSDCRHEAMDTWLNMDLTENGWAKGSRRSSVALAGPATEHKSLKSHVEAQIPICRIAHTTLVPTSHVRPIHPTRLRDENCQTRDPQFRRFYYYLPLTRLTCV